MLRLVVRSKAKFTCEICRTYLSHEYKTALGAFDISQHVTANKGGAQGIILTDIVNGFLEVGKGNEAFESFLKLRSLPEKSNTYEATSYAIFRNFIDNENVDDLLPLIKKRLESGLFVDNFVGCYLLNYFLQEKNFLAATELGVEFYKQDNLDNKLTVALILKSCLNYLRENIEEIGAPAKEEKPLKKSNEIKVRVKFVRNPESNKFSIEIGRMLCRIADLHRNDLTINLKLLGFLLDEKYDLAASLLSKNVNFFKDILQYSQELIKNKNQVQENLTKALQAQSDFERTNLKGFDTVLTSFLEEAKKEEEAKLITEQKSKFLLWKEEDSIGRKKIVNAVPVNIRKENIEKVLSDLEQNKQKLWYFENEDLVDLEIFKKKKFYPKRWFGKKKKPRTVDDSYIPPEVNKKLA